MTEKSYFWTCQPIGDGGPNSFSQKAVMNILGLFNHTYTPESTGIIPWKETNTSILETLGFGAAAPTQELVPTYNSGTLTIGSGLAMTGGTFYINSTPVDFDIAVEKSGYANAVDRIVLRRTTSDQTARLVYVKSTGAGLTAPLVNTSVYWDIPIARIVLSGAGTYSSFIDDRRYVSSPNANRVLLHERDAYLDNSICTMDIANTKYRELELLIELKPNVSNVTIEVYFTPQPTSPVYTKQQLEASGPVVSASSLTSAVGWTWAATTGSQLVLQIRFPMYNTQNARLTASGTRHAFFTGRGGDSVVPFPYISGSLIHFSSTSLSAVLENLVVDLSGTTYDPGSRVSLYGIK